MLNKQRLKLQNYKMNLEVLQENYRKFKKVKQI